MTRDEVIKIQMVIQAAYPNYNPPNKTITADTWLVLLNDFTYEQVLAAVHAFIRTDKKGFAPSIGEVIDKLQLLFGEKEANAVAAWTMVLKAIKNSTYHADEEYEKLPRIIQRVIGGPQRLTELATMENLNTSVESSNFMRDYRAALEADREIQKLPPELKMLTNKACDKLEAVNSVKRISVSEERERATKEARPMPESARVKLERIMRNDNSIK